MASTSSLLRSAAGIRNQIANYQDSLMAYEYSNSAYTDSAYLSYKAYIQSRLSQLQGVPSVAAMSRALTLTKALDDAGKKNISATIQRENIQVLSGNATLSDKYNVIASEFMRAQQNGDMTLAQTLEGQAYSLSQTIQQQAQASATANAANNGRNWADTAQSLKDALTKFNTDYANAGQKSSDKIVSDFVKSIQPQLEKAGIVLQDGMQPNYFDIVDGVNRAIYKSYQNAATVEAPYDTTGVTTRSYIDKANAALTAIPTVYGNMSAQELQQAQANPNQYSYREDPQYVSGGKNDVGGKLNPQTGYQQTQNGIQPTFSSSPFLDVPNNVNNKLQSLGLRIVTANGNGTEVASTDKTPQWLQKILPENSTTHVLSDGADSNGNSTLQFEADAQNGQGKAIFTVAKDNTVWESSATGDRLVNGTPAPAQPESLFGNIGDAFKWGMSHVDTMLNAGKGLLMGHAYAATLPSNMMLQQQLQQQWNNPSMKPIPVSQKPLQLPSLNIAHPTPTPNIAVSPAINPYPTAPTANPQTTAPSTTIQSGGQGISLQGGSGNSGFSLQGGGGGFSLQ